MPRGDGAGGHAVRPGLHQQAIEFQPRLVRKGAERDDAELAIERAKRINGGKFIVPVVVDAGLGAPSHAAEAMRNAD